MSEFINNSTMRIDALTDLKLDFKDVVTYKTDKNVRLIEIRR